MRTFSFQFFFLWELFHFNFFFMRAFSFQFFFYENFFINFFYENFSFQFFFYQKFNFSFQFLFFFFYEKKYIYIHKYLRLKIILQPIQAGATVRHFSNTTNNLLANLATRNTAKFLSLIKITTSYRIGKLKRWRHVRCPLNPTLLFDIFDKELAQT